MCRLMFIIGAKESDKIQPFMIKAKKHLSKGNTDGLGYTAIKGDGSIFTERWLDNDEALEEVFTEDDNTMVEELGDFLDADGSMFPYTQQGQVDFSDVRTVMLHTRFATCGKGIDNVHPFVDDTGETAIVHNGVINNHLTFSKLNSTCDSEVLLTEYMRLGVSADVSKLEELSNSLKGYWAVGSTSKDQDGTRVLDIYRSNGSATLFGLYVKQLGAMVFSTKVDIIIQTMKDMNWRQDNTIFEVNPYVATRFNGVTGKVMEVYKWENNNTVEKIKNFNQKSPVQGHWDDKQKKWIYPKDRTIALVPEIKDEDTKGNRKTSIIASNFVDAYDSVYQMMDKCYEFISEEDYNDMLDDKLLELISEVEGDLTKEENEELNNLPYDMIPEFIQGIIKKRKEA